MPAAALTSIADIKISVTEYWIAASGLELCFLKHFARVTPGPVDKSAGSIWLHGTLLPRDTVWIKRAAVCTAGSARGTNATGALAAGAKERSSIREGLG